MNKRDAKILAEKVTNQDLLQMFKNAKEKIKDWSVVSNCNKGLSKGIAWNILAKDFDVNSEFPPRTASLVKTNMIREFGEYLPDHIKPSKRVKSSSDRDCAHREPDFTNWKR